MIVREQPSLLHVLISFRHSVLLRVWPRVLFTTGLAVAVTAVERSGMHVATLTTTPFILIGAALGIFLGFRTNASYDRFWEGRQLWGRLVNVTRTFTRQLDLFVVPDGPDAVAFKRGVVLTTIGYVHAFRVHLRFAELDEHASRYLGPELTAAIEARRNKPNAVLQDVSRRIRAVWREGWISDYHLASLDRSLEELTSIQGGCERIRNTPLPYSYNFLVHRIAAFYCVLLPFGVHESVGTMTPIVTFMLSYALFGLDAIGGEVEEPFGLDLNDLPLSTISRNIEIDLLQMIGERHTPAPVQPVNDVLL